MSEFVFYDDAIQPFSDAKINAVSAAALYGRGVFTTVAIFDGKPFQWDLHERRLRANAAQIHLNSNEIKFADLHNAMLELIAANKIEDGRARITLFDDASGRIWSFSDEPQTVVLIVAAPKQNPPESLKLTISPFLINSTSPLAGVKSCNYLENLLALENAKKNGFDEAVRINECGAIVSAIMANVFWIKDEIVFTPALSTGALDGTTRRFVIESMRQNNAEVREVVENLAVLEFADEIFLTSTNLKICGVEKFQNRVLQKHRTIQLKCLTKFSR